MKISNRSLIFCLIIINSLMFLYGYIMMDSARDISQAIDIAKGENYPLLGPDIGGFAHVGPIWFYFLAIPALTGSLSFISLWVGFFSSLKFILAYNFGEKVYNKRFAWLMVCALCLPGWQSIDNMVLMHTNVVITLTLAFLLCFYNCMIIESLRNFKWLLLIYSLAIHAHPSTLILGVFIVYLLVKKWKKLNFNDLFLAALLFILPFIPYIYDQINSGFPDWQRVNSRLSEDKTRTIIQRLSNFIFSLFYFGPLQIRNFIAMWNQLAGNLVFVIYGLSLFFGIIGTLKYVIGKYSNIYLVIKFLSVFIVLCILLLLLRSFIPFYMMLVLVPFMSIIIAFGLFQLFNQVKKVYFCRFTNFLYC